uniref:Putative salivary protein n=1 Tax=Ixodes ricinus TaxID=34613 RepID=C8Z2H0_IXORI|nr:putative salivary protein [Ixodes ricinus]
MKVVCILLLFVIATGETSDSVILKFPKYIPDHKKLAGDLLDICKNYSETHGSSSTSSGTKIAINDKYVSFKNCTFLCKYGSSNVTLDMPPNTLCGPGGQTCKNKTHCIEHIPGC